RGRAGHGRGPGRADLAHANRLERQLRKGHYRRSTRREVTTLMSLNTLIRKARPGEIETLADIAFVAWQRDLQPFLSGAAASAGAERERLTAAVSDGLDRIIVAEVNGLAVGWCQRARGRAYIPFLFVTPLLQNNG